MRIAISNRYWATAGGGEAYAIAVARVLAERGDVDLLAPPDVDWATVGERLQTRLDGLATRPVDFEDVTQLRRVIAGYDLFVNGTWGDDLVPCAARNVLVVHFPAPPPDPSRPLAASARRVVARAVAARVAVPLFVDGFHPAEHGARAFRWTSGDGVIDFAGGGRAPQRVELVFGSENPVPVDVAVEVAGRTQARATIPPGRGDTALVVDLGPHRTVRIRSNTFSPRETLGTDDDRRLGVQLVDARVVDGRWARLPRRVLAGGGALGMDRAAVYRSYDRLLVNSEFTRRWMRRWWGEDAAVVHPGVTPRPRLRKQPVIVAVGRFFPPERGHSKAQLEMVRAFGTLRATCPAAAGWTLHLVGGCQDVDRPYLDRVRAEAGALPVRFHVDASGREVSELYGRASVLWHATGLGQPADAPHRHEHFGISVVEGMSAGAVPVVYGRGGPAVTVRPGVDGLHFRTVGELAAATARLVEDEPLRARLGASARVRAAAYSFDAMRAELLRALPV